MGREESARLGHLDGSEAIVKINLSHAMAKAEANKSSLQGTSVKELERRLKTTQEVLRLFKHGVMLLDEVDLILHPLKSELNFPTGQKFDLDGSEEGVRWGLPIHLMDAVFYAQLG